MDLPTGTARRYTREAFFKERRVRSGLLARLSAVGLALALPGAAVAEDAGTDAVASSPRWKPGQTVPRAPAMTSVMRSAAPLNPAKDVPLPRPAKARTFEGLLATSEPSPDLPSLVGALLKAACPPDAGVPDGADCGAADAGAHEVTLGKVFRITSADPDAVGVSDFNLRLMGETVTAKGCLACKKPIVLPGSAPPRYVTLRAPTGRSPSLSDGLPEVGRRTMKFGSIAKAMDWLEGTAPLLRVEIVFRATPTPWTLDDGRRGIALDGLGVRVYNICTGDVVLSTPPSSSWRVDSLLEVSACRAAAARVAAARAEDPAESPRPPLRLTTAQIERAMKAIRPSLKACYEKYHVPGTVLVNYVIKDGLVESVRLQGNLKGTPTGACALEAVRSVSFPGRKASGSFAYPFVLRGP